jgi:hypothetical protein
MGVGAPAFPAYSLHWSTRRTKAVPRSALRSLLPYYRGSSRYSRPPWSEGARRPRTSGRASPRSGVLGTGSGRRSGRCVERRVLSETSGQEFRPHRLRHVAHELAHTARADQALDVLDLATGALEAGRLTTAALLHDVDAITGWAGRVFRRQITRSRSACRPPHRREDRSGRPRPANLLGATRAASRSLPEATVTGTVGGGLKARALDAAAANYNRRMGCWSIAKLGDAGAT